jgi:hypothetical protein
MRVLVLIKANHDSENGKLPSPRLVSEMSRFNEELIAAGVLKAADGLYPSVRGKRVKFAAGSGTTTVVDGPFAETKELVAGFWIWQVASIEEAVEWVKRIPNPDSDGPDGEVEIRPIFDATDFMEQMPDDVRARGLKMIDKLTSV